MLRSRSILFDFVVVVFIFILFFVPSKTKGQAWSGMLAPNRAINWSSAGAGTIPARATICQALGVAGQAESYPQSVTYLQIMTALQACAGTNETVYLNPGTYTMDHTLGNYNGSSYVATPSNVTLRGAGPQQTILKWTATSNTCNGYGSTAFCIFNGDSSAQPYSPNTINITGGLSQGSTSLTMGSAVNGSLSNLQIGALLQITQTDQASDNGAWWACGSTGTTGDCAQQGTANTWGGRTTSQTVTVTGISGSTVTISSGLYAPTWSTGNTPYATFSNSLPVTGFGVENLQINTQSIGDTQAMLEFWWVTNSWAKNIAFINNVAGAGSTRKHMLMGASQHLTVRDSYMYGSSPSSEGYGVDFIWGVSDSLVENNICQHVAACLVRETSIGNVFGYNYAVDNFYTGNGTAPNWQGCDVDHHDAGDYYNLIEGHEGISDCGDDIHGTSFAETTFRSYFNGHDAATQCPGGGNACGTGPKTQNTVAFGVQAYNRYWNLVASVLGTSGYHTTYQYVSASGAPCTSYGWNGVYNLAFSWTLTAFASACGDGTPWTIYNDPLMASSLMRWGNYDTVSGSVQTNSGETGSGASAYPGLSSPSTSWSSYPSLYLSGTPSWLVFPGGSGPSSLPLVGPDITGGNIANVGGHAYHNPAANCFLNVLGGQTNGSSGVLPFDASLCYPTSAANASGPLAPLNLTGTVVQ
jgi:hypothetical protein